MMAKSDPAAPAGAKTTSIGADEPTGTAIEPLATTILESTAPVAPRITIKSYDEPAKPNVEQAAPAAKTTIIGHDDLTAKPLVEAAKTSVEPVATATVEPGAPEVAASTIPAYVELSSRVYTLIIDAYAAASRRRVDYFKSIFEIVSRPYEQVSLERTARENVDRTSEIISLSIAEFEISGREAAEFSKRWLDNSAKVQDYALTATRTLVKTGVSNFEAAKDSTNAQLDRFIKSVDAAQNGHSAG